jgi:hypothetical protein
MTDDGIEWEGPLCPECGRELDVEALVSELGIRVAYRCPAHGLASLGDPFDSARPN